VSRPTVRVAAAQLALRAGDIPGNLVLHRDAIAEARARGVELLVFPELSLTGYLAAPDLPALGRDRGALEVAQLAEAAGPMRVVMGFIEAAAPGVVHNAAALLDGTGLRHVHRKLYLPTYGRLEEGRHYAPGDGVEVVDLGDGWRLATLVCADLWNPAYPWLAALAGATVLAAPVASARDVVGAGFDPAAGWATVAGHTAALYGLPLILCNGCGGAASHPEGLAFWGGSRILDPFGRVLAEAGGEPALLVADLDRDAVRRARATLPTVRDLDPRRVAAVLDGHLDEHLRRRAAGSM
jgi:N-carbamoylputrescine amidase